MSGPALRTEQRPGARLRIRRFRHARRTVCLVTGLVLFSQFALNVTVDTIRPDLRDPEYGCRLANLRALQEDSPDQPLLLILGSSRTQMGLCPSEIIEHFPKDLSVPIVFNYGIAGCGPLQQWLVLQRLFAAGIRPAFLMVEVLPPVLHQDGDGADMFRIARLGWQDLGWLRPYCQNPEGMFGDWCRERVSPWFALRFNLMSRLLPSWLPWQQRVDFMWRDMDTFGWLPYPWEDPPPERRQQATEHARQEYLAHLTNYHISPIPDHALRQLLKECSKRGIPVALYCMPEGPTFRSWYPQAAENALYNYLDRLQSEYGVRIFDARTWLAEKDFADSHHLLRCGALAFSARLARSCLGPWLAEDRRRLRPLLK